MAAKDGGNDLLKNIDNLEDGAWKVDSVVNAATAIQSLAKDKLLLPAPRASRTPSPRPSGATARRRSSRAVTGSRMR
jgi:hypothetical protein